jgi:hypothetical protein
MASWCEIEMKLFQHFKEQNPVLRELRSVTFGVAVRVRFVIAVDTTLHLGVSADLQHMAESIEKFQRWVEHGIRKLVRLESHIIARSNLVCFRCTSCYACGSVPDLQHLGLTTMLSRHALDIVRHGPGKVQGSIGSKGSSD